MRLEIKVSLSEEEAEILRKQARGEALTLEELGKVQIITLLNSEEADKILKEDA